MRKKSGNKAASPVAAAAPGVCQKPKRQRLLASVVVLLLVLGALLAYVVATRAPSSASVGSSMPPVAVNPEKPGKTATYVGAAVCKTCHEGEFKAWSGSHHDLAMQAATAATVLGNFADVRFRHKGIESSFFKRGDKFMVRTDGPDGKLADYEIAYTFGVYPLQQYLIAFPGGRYQALPIAWDARPKDQGGQRWFHLQPGEKIDHKDPLHWTGRYQNWALQCAECHSTDLKKGYDAASDTYKTTYSEINVACEACHGQGSRHVDWAREAKAPYAAHGDKGLPALKTRWKEAWQFPASDARFAVRDKPADPAGMNTCAACHARRSTLSEDAQGRRAAGRQPPPGDADGAQLPRRRPAARRGLCLGFLPAEQDAPERRHLHGLPRAAFAEAARRGQCAVHALPQCRRIRCPQTPPARCRRQGRPVRHLPHADAELHGDPCPPGPQPARPASRPVAVARQPERLYPVPRGQEAGMGGERHGQVVWQGMARTPALRHRRCMPARRAARWPCPACSNWPPARRRRRSSGRRRRRSPSPMPAPVRCRRRERCCRTPIPRCASRRSACWRRSMWRTA